MEILLLQKAYCEKMRLKNGWRASTLVFPRDGKTERPLTQNYVSKKFSIYCHRIGLAGFIFHSLRHTHATMLVAAGVHSKSSSTALGTLPLQ
nr:tyrosine-type recombinase/integrase [uncultured Dialister sp.]